MTYKKWKVKEIAALYELPFIELLYQAHEVHRAHFDVNEMELCRILSIKTGACPEDCAYCPQSGHYHTNLKKENLLATEIIVNEAKYAKQQGITRFCMGAAWRSPPEKYLPALVAIIKQIKALGLETCMTLGMLTHNEAVILKAAGLDYYNHNIDSSRKFYSTIITTRTFQDRLQTLKHVRKSGMKVCCGGILGMGETRQDRIHFLKELANLHPQPESVPINRLIPIPGTPLANVPPIDNFEFIRTIALSRILMPQTMLRLSAGRATMSYEMQTLCFIAGANSLWLGDRLLTADNHPEDKDSDLFQKLNLRAKQC